MKSHKLFTFTKTVEKQKNEPIHLKEKLKKKKIQLSQNVGLTGALLSSILDKMCVQTIMANPELEKLAAN